MTKLPEILENYFEYMNDVAGKSEQTVRGYESDLTLFFKYMKSRKKLTTAKIDDIDDISYITTEFIRNITIDDLTAFSVYLTKRGNSKQAKARKIAALRSFWKYLCKKARIVNENIAEDLEIPKLEERQVSYMTLDESQGLLNLIKTTEGKYRSRDYCILTVFLNCGVRLSELVGMNISSIKNDILTVIGKGDKPRTVYLNEMTLKAVNEYLKDRLQIQDKLSKEDKDALFISRNYTRINKRSVEKIVKKYMDLAGLDTTKLHTHSCRHTAATLMYKYGNVDINALREILGHKKITTTERYTHVDNEDARKAVNSNPLRG